ncbi:hypothetical protein ZORO111903_09515 [Zobellia roscoffensis]|uniref:hypothetical protein n=1 Tax=Zobellia roscoffensis TaxID=2779508 RepID=UPI00188AC6A7|nr:hypothetical protein [Zobellia roscoffensis]
MPIKKVPIAQPTTPPLKEIDILSALDDVQVEEEEEIKEIKTEPKVPVAEAFALGLKIKKSTLNENSYYKYENRILQFQR